METASNGTYSLGGLASGSYRLEFQDGSGTYLTQYYKNSLDLTSATAIAVTAPKTTATSTPLWRWPAASAARL